MKVILFNVGPLNQLQYLTFYSVELCFCSYLTLIAWSYYIFACTSPIVDIIYENKRVSFTLKFLSTVSFFWAR